MAIVNGIALESNSPFQAEFCQTLCNIWKQIILRKLYGVCFAAAVKNGVDILEPPLDGKGEKMYSICL